MMSLTTLTPYDTGERCEPRPWQPDHPSVVSAMRSGETEDIGKVDFDDDTNETVVTVYVAKDPATGRHVVHVIPFVGEDERRSVCTTSRPSETTDSVHLCVTPDHEPRMALGPG